MSVYGADGLEKGVVTGGETCTMVYTAAGAPKSSSTSGGAPTNADYVVGTANASLSAELVATDTTSIDFIAGAGTATWQRAALTGDVTASANSNSTTIANDAVTNGKMRDSTALSVIGRSANSTGDPADISTSAASAQVLRESGSTIGWGTVATAGIADDAVTDAKLRESAALSVIGRSANSTGNPADIATSASSKQVLREQGSALVFGSVPSSRNMLYSFNTPVVIDNDAAETTIMSYTIPANTLAANDQIIAFCDNRFFNNSGANRGFTVRAKLGGSTVAAWAYGSSLGSVNQNRWYPTWVFIIANGATNSQYVLLTLETTGTNVTGSLSVGLEGAHSASSKLWVRSDALTNDMTASCALSLTIQMTTNLSTLEWTTYSGTVEHLSL